MELIRRSWSTEEENREKCTRVDIHGEKKRGICIDEESEK